MNSISPLLMFAKVGRTRRDDPAGTFSELEVATLPPPHRAFDLAVRFVGRQEYGVGIIEPEG